MVAAHTADGKRKPYNESFRRLPADFSLVLLSCPLPCHSTGAPIR